MEKIAFDNKRMAELLRSDCEQCFGFCCAALYFTATDGFPVNKEAGKPCPHLAEAFRCNIHPQLQQKGLKGCMAYDCFGAGQRVAQMTFEGKDWRTHAKLKPPMFESFLTVHKLHEMLWYLSCAERSCKDESLKEKLQKLMVETDDYASSTSEQLKTIDLIAHREKVNQLLSINSELVRSAYQTNGKGNGLKKPAAGRKDFFGADLRKMDLRGADLRGALLIAANLSQVDLSGADLIAADLRDANLCGANLSKSLNLTQIQISGAKGNAATQLPEHIIRPRQW